MAVHWEKNGIFSNGAGAAGKKLDSKPIAIYINQPLLKQKPKCKGQNDKAFKGK